ncbi:phage holin, LLH family [Limosilactobacillus sp.]|jgi:hypothetical protein|uniref:phage holin, LLH family n=1 Tax=Limosilactobacillus sp. TaxID=2773925 RepID=UPI0025BC1E3B|nr:phage holin, LLH family [Limosilactobacillus sp.]MCH3922403.1 phage holin, LLH family [Limosilactobacillus sp.]MCH3929175.1 phage holin, LLH family [Limosilactobacillus sp.]
MKTANTIINWIIQSGAIVWLFYFALAIGKPWVEGKVKTAKTTQQKEAWTLLEQVAMTAVNSLVGSDKDGDKKFVEASTQTQAYLENHGIDIDMHAVQAAVQAAYEKSPLTGQQNTESTVTTSTDGVTTSITKHDEKDPVLEAIKTAPNRANDLAEEGEK